LNYKTGCVVCGGELVYHDKYSKLECFYCNNKFDTNVVCINGHFICDICHSLPAYETIQQFCLNINLTDPIEMALILMQHNSIKMHGPEHHYLVPAVLLSAFYNINGEPIKKKDQLDIAKKRSKNVLGGFCGFYGCCGAAIGAGIFMSLITGATPLSKKEWQLSNMLTASVLHSIATSGGPRCCKRDTFIALLESIKFLKNIFQTSINYSSNFHCKFSSLNQQCLNHDCIFFSK
jgi:hypothetical protein